MKLMLGSAVCDAPACWRNFIRSNRHKLKALMQDDINSLLKEEPCRVTLRRERKGTGIMTFNMKTMTSEPSKLGYWYLDFPSKQDYLIFNLRWA